MHRPQKLYIAVRADLAPGLQCSQAVHAAHAFAVAHREAFEEWHRDSNTIVIVSAKDTEELEALRAKAASRSVPFAEFIDDDLGDQVTAVAMGPGGAARKICWGLPLALKGA